MVVFNVSTPRDGLVATVLAGMGRHKFNRGFARPVKTAEERKEI
jgi:hypothetical protein